MKLRTLVALGVSIFCDSQAVACWAEGVGGFRAADLNNGEETELKSAVKPGDEFWVSCGGSTSCSMEPFVTTLFWYCPMEVN